MIQCGCGLSLTSQSFKHLRLFGEMGGKKFKGDKAVESEVLCLIDHAHSPAADRFNDAVVRNDSANQWGRVRHANSS
jgi:hypothetical protein